MKITKLVLKNFSAVHNAMDSNYLEIFLEDCVNRICLLIGRNGGGKTTILSLLSPFSDLGNLDVRNTQPLILKGKEGYKEIHILDGKDKYVIKHIYTPHEGKSHSVKSYISKNDNELNINGNVTSFKEYVRGELQIEPDYLKLIRLGPNVTSLINLSETERKNFMGKILDDIGIYLEFYKNVNNKLKQVKEFLNITINKQDRLGIADEEEIKTDIDNLNRLIVTASRDFVNYSNQVAILEDGIKKLGSIEELKSEYSIYKSKLEKAEKRLQDNRELAKSNPDKINKELLKLKDQSSDYESQISKLKGLVQGSISHINTLLNRIDSLNKDIRKEENLNDEINDLNIELKTIQSRIDRSKKIIKDFEPRVTKEEYDSFVVFLKNMNQKLEVIYEFGKKPIERVISLIEEGVNVREYITKKIRYLDEKNSVETNLFIARMVSKMTFKDQVVTDCKNTCEAKILYEMMKEAVSDNQYVDKKEDVSFYKDVEYTYENLINLLKSFKDYEDIMKRLPEEFYITKDTKKLFKKLKNREKLFKEKDINEYLSYITEYYNYQNDIILYKEKEVNIKKLKGLNRIDSFKKEKKEVEDELNKIQTEDKSRKKKISDLTEDKTDLDRTIELYEDLVEDITNYHDIKEKKEDYESKINRYKECIGFIYDLNKKKNDASREETKLRTELQNKTTKFTEYKKYSKEIKKLNKKVGDLILIKDALSSKTGIPLHYILNYLGNIVEVTNDLLSIVYKDDIYLDDFEISPTSFSIPFYNKGVRIPDVKYASQGEVSFLSIALSFALSSRAISKYNIMLLDEIDGPLDTINREKFIQIIERQIDMVNSEQNFLITHNEMFSSYPVDIIDLSFKNDKEAYPLANFIEIKKK